MNKPVTAEPLKYKTRVRVVYGFYRDLTGSLESYHEGINHYTVILDGEDRMRAVIEAEYLQEE